MENINELRSNLLSISNKLFKKGLLENQNINDINTKINESAENDLFEYALYFLKISLLNSKESLIIKELEKIYSLAQDTLIDDDFYNQICNTILSSINRNSLPIIVDRYFASLNPVNKLRLYVPIFLKDTIMIDLYSLYATIKENYQNHIHASEIAIFDDKLEIEVYSYKINSNNELIIEEFINENGETKCLHSTIDTDLDLCFEDFNEEIKIETPEFAFLYAIEGNCASDFIKAMDLKDIVNFKKFNRIKIIRKDIKEEKKNGLQKIS